WSPLCPSPLPPVERTRAGARLNTDLTALSLSLRIPLLSGMSNGTYTARCGRAGRSRKLPAAHLSCAVRAGQRRLRRLSGRFTPALPWRVRATGGGRCRRASKVTGIRFELDRLVSYDDEPIRRAGAFPVAPHPAATRPDPPAPLRWARGREDEWTRGLG